VIEARIKELFGELIRVNASGRTDAGVNARGQVFHFDARWRHGAEKLRTALRRGLPPALQIISLKAVTERFHARFSATGKTYVYQLKMGETDPFTRTQVWAVERSLDVAAMSEAARVLEGRHDFRAFCALNGPPKTDTVRNLRRLNVVQRGRAVRITATADGFLYKMVRTLVGALVAVGDGKLRPEDLRELLASGRRIPAVITAPPQGLFLAKVYYSGRPMRQPVGGPERGADE
jgi:tRNA pseudouridine38-40 synthase